MQYDGTCFSTCALLSLHKMATLTQTCRSDIGLSQNIAHFLVVQLFYTTFKLHWDFVSDKHTGCSVLEPCFNALEPSVGSERVWEGSALTIVCLCWSTHRFSSNLLSCLFSHFMTLNKKVWYCSACHINSVPVSLVN